MIAFTQSPASVLLWPDSAEKLIYHPKHVSGLELIDVNLVKKIMDRIGYTGVQGQLRSWCLAKEELVNANILTSAIDDECKRGVLRLLQGYNAKIQGMFYSKWESYQVNLEAYLLVL